MATRMTGKMMRTVAGVKPFSPFFDGSVVVVSACGVVWLACIEGAASSSSGDSVCFVLHAQERIVEVMKMIMPAVT